MSVIHSCVQGGESVDIGDNIANSLMLDSGSSQYLSRTPSIAGNRKTFTYVVQVKRGKLSSLMGLFSCGPQSAGNAALEYYADNTITVDRSAVIAVSTVAVYQDSAAYVQVVFSVDTTLASNKVKIYCNGSIVYSGDAGYTLNADTEFNRASVEHDIGRGYAGTANFFEGYFSAIYFVDGQALTPSSFGRISVGTGQWVPKNYTGTYGANGFKLDFTNGTALGTDSSGNGNNWTLNGGITSANQYSDTPTNNYAVLNPLGIASSTLTLSKGNTKSVCTTSSVSNKLTGSMAVTTEKVYWETKLTAAAVQVYIGVVKAKMPVLTGNESNMIYFDWSGGGIYNAAFALLGAGTYAVNDVLGWALDGTADTLAIYKNNVLVYTVTSLRSNMGINAGEAITQSMWSGGTNNSNTVEWNFGAIGSGFAFTPPAGFKALCTENLPTPAIIKPSLHFQALLDTGANIKANLAALFTYYLDWIKDRANANNHQLIDTVRGSSAVLQSNTTAAETTYTAPSGSSVGWAWNMRGAPVTNNAGSITSQVSANVLAGQSVVTYTGTGANATVGHGLSVAPKMLIVKCRGAASQWGVYHTGLDATPQNYAVILNATSAKELNSLYWNNNAPTSTVFSLGGSGAGNTSGQPHVAYCFAEIEGYSKIGSCVGNVSVDGTFVPCGFKPARVMIKSSTAADDWRIYDNDRPGYNVQGGELAANTTAAETTVAEIDFTATGFKLRIATTPNAAQTYIFYAIAEAPQKYSTGR